MKQKTDREATRLIKLTKPKIWWALRLESYWNTGIHAWLNASGNLQEHPHIMDRAHAIYIQRIWKDQIPGAVSKPVLRKFVEVGR